MFTTTGSTASTASTTSTTSTAVSRPYAGATFNKSPVDQAATSRAQAFKEKYRIHYGSQGNTPTTEQVAAKTVLPSPDVDQNIIQMKATNPISPKVKSKHTVASSTLIPGYPVVGRILRLPQLIQFLGLSRSTVYDRLDMKSPRYDPTFPRKVKLGRSAVGWLEVEVLAWIAQQAATRPK